MDNVQRFFDEVLQTKERDDADWRARAEIIKRAREIVDAELGARGDSMERVLLVIALATAALTEFGMRPKPLPFPVKSLDDECPQLDEPALTPEGWRLRCLATRKDCEHMGYREFFSCLHYRMERLLAERRQEREA